MHASTKLLIVAAITVVCATTVIAGHHLTNPVLDDRDQSRIGATADGECGFCEKSLPCTTCFEQNGIWVKCTSENTYFECIPAHAEDQCGNCQEWNVDCGIYKTCTGQLCQVCTGTQSCNGCSKVTGEHVTVCFQ